MFNRKPKKIYIAGKVSGLDWKDVLTKFQTAKEKAKLQFKTAECVITPIDLCDSSESWDASMAKCLSALLNCDTVIFMSDWIDSKGAKIEKIVSEGSDKKVYFFDKNYNVI